MWFVHIKDHVMKIDLFRHVSKYKIESLILLAIFVFTWLGFGKYTAGVIAVAFLICLFIKERRAFLFDYFKDGVLITLLILFTFNNIISSLFSIEKLESTVLSIVFFLVIFIPLSYVRFSLNRNNEFFIRWVVPAGLAVAIVILLYIFTLFFKTLITEGFIIKRYTFYFLGKASTPDVIVMLGGLGYGFMRQQREVKYHWLGFLYLLLCFCCIILTYDRGSTLAFFVVMVLLFAFDYKRLILLFGILAFIIALSFIFKPFERLQHLFNYLYLKSSWERLMSHTQLATFKGAWEMIKDHWLLGVGTGNYAAFSKQYGTGRWYTYAHNFVLQFWAENGLFGMIFGLSIIGLILYRWAKSWKLYKYKYIALGVGVCFIGMLIGNLTNSTIWMIKIALPFWLLAGVMNAIYYIVKEGKLPEHVSYTSPDTAQ